MLQISGKYLTTTGYRAFGLQTLQTSNYRHEYAKKSNISNQEGFVMSFS
jgi:hypothetical protein